MKYEIYFKEDKKYPGKRVKFDNGEDYCVNTDNEGKEYFPVPNIYTDDSFKLFLGCIKDALTTIREGNGDVLSIGGTPFCPGGENVYKYVDREYGEHLRQKTIEGFNNTEFGYSIKFGYLNSMSGSRFVSENNKILTMFDDQRNYIFFSTIEEAENYKNKVLSIAEKVKNGYLYLKNNNYPEEMRKNCLRSYESLNIIKEVYFAMIREKKDVNNKWKIEIVQAIKLD